MNEGELVESPELEGFLAEGPILEGELVESPWLDGFLAEG